MLLPRILTALVGIPLLLVCVFAGFVPFSVLMAGICALALSEYFTLARLRHRVLPVEGMALGMLLFSGIVLGGGGMGGIWRPQTAGAVLSLVPAVLALSAMIRFGSERAIETMAVSAFGPLLVAWGLAHLVLLRGLHPGGSGWVFFLMGLVWIIDTAAYGVGSWIGRRKLAMRVSPGKTVEGALGGAAAGMLAALLLRLLFIKDLAGPGEAALLGLCVAVIGQFSDLAESLIKRDAGVKDSAQILPGHGGMLDRFDSFLFAAPFLYYYLALSR